MLLTLGLSRTQDPQRDSQEQGPLGEGEEAERGEGRTVVPHRVKHAVEGVQSPIAGAGREAGDVEDGPDDHRRDAEGPADQAGDEGADEAGAAQASLGRGFRRC